VQRAAGVGPSADLRVVDAAAFPFALLYFTGSKAHNIVLRARAQKLGLKLNEYALIREADGSAFPPRTRQDIYRALGTELGRTGAARGSRRGRSGRNGTPSRAHRAVGSQRDSSLPFRWSDGNATIEEMAQAARAMGMSYLGLCDHSRSAAYAGGMSIERLYEQHAAIDALNARFDDGFRILKGIEVDILVDGALDYPDDVLERLDLVVASVHSRFNLSAEEQTARILRAVNHPWSTSSATSPGASCCSAIRIRSSSRRSSTPRRSVASRSRSTRTPIVSISMTPACATRWRAV
jgi:DNA polymerase (family 10)